MAAWLTFALRVHAVCLPLTETAAKSNTRTGVYLSSMRSFEWSLQVIPQTRWHRSPGCDRSQPHPHACNSGSSARVFRLSCVALPSPRFMTTPNQALVTVHSYPSQAALQCILVIAPHVVHAPAARSRCTDPCAPDLSLGTATAESHHPHPSHARSVQRRSPRPCGRQAALQRTADGGKPRQ
jgi:hypothetical protein